MLVKKNRGTTRGGDGYPAATRRSRAARTPRRAPGTLWARAARRFCGSHGLPDCLTASIRVCRHLSSLASEWSGSNCATTRSDKRGIMRAAPNSAAFWRMVSKHFPLGMACSNVRAQGGRGMKFFLADLQPDGVAGPRPAFRRGTHGRRRPAPSRALPGGGAAHASRGGPRVVRGAKVSPRHWAGGR